MLDRERMKEADQNVKRYLEEGLLKTSEDDAKRLVGFYIKNSETSLITASVLFQVSTDIKSKENLKLKDDFESYLWVIVSSYYSMFYMANALLSKHGIKTGKEIAHKVTADALIHFFISKRKLIRLLSDYEKMRNDAMELMSKENIPKKAEELIASFEYERKKRSKFQYDIGLSAKQKYAKTSLERAKLFFTEIRQTIEK